MASTWRSDRMSLLEFLRKSSATGDIAGWLREKHRQEQQRGDSTSLHNFAENYAMQGEQIVATDYLWRLNDRYFGQWCMMNLPFRTMAYFADVAGIEKVPARYRWFATALVLTDNMTCAPLRGYWREPSNLANDMQLEGKPTAVIEDVQKFVESLTVEVDAYLSGHVSRAEEDAVLLQGNGDESGSGEALRGESLAFEGKQLLLFNLIRARTATSMEAQNATEDVQIEQARARLQGVKHRPLICSGKPGTGKTTVALDCVRKALDDGACVLVASPTARMAARLRQRMGSLPNLVIETVAAAFQLHLPEEEGLFAMYGFNLVIVDEYSQLSEQDFARLLRLWAAADRIPGLVFLGDKYQLPGVHPTRPWEGAAWKACRNIELTKSFRSQDPHFLETLELLRSSMPTKVQLNAICRGRKAWLGAEPSAADLARLLAAHPEATFVAATRRGVALINGLALEALHPNEAPLATLPGTYEDNPDNYHGSQLRENRLPLPADVPIYMGARLYLTRNVRKADDYVNGMLCTVLDYCPTRKILWVRTETGTCQSRPGTTQTSVRWSTFPYAQATAALWQRSRGMNFLSSWRTLTYPACPQ